MKVKVILAKPQIKNKSIKGGTYGGYVYGFQGNCKVGTVVEVGRGMKMGMGMGMEIPRGMDLVCYNGKFFYCRYFS